MAELDSDPQFDSLRGLALAGHRVMVIAQDRATALTWCRFREMPKGDRAPMFIDDPNQLVGVNDDGMTSLVLVQGYAAHRKWTRLETQIKVLSAGGVPLYKDRIPDHVEKAPPAINACAVRVGGSVIPLSGPPSSVFEIRAPNGNKVNVSRDQAKSLIEVIEAWLEGAEYVDPELARAEQIKAAVEATGDPYARA